MDLKEYLTTLSKENLISLTQLGLFYQTVFKYQKMKFKFMIIKLPLKSNQKS